MFVVWVHRGWERRRLPRSSRRNSEVPFTQTSGPVRCRKSWISPVSASGIQYRQVFFIDEVHRLLPDVEERCCTLRSKISTSTSLIGTGPGARTHSIPLQRFTAIGATTRQGLVSAPMRGRFGLVLRLNHYDVAALKQIVERSSRLLTTPIDSGGAEEIARRSRGTPRIANRLLRRVRDYAQVRAHGDITQAVAETALDVLLEVRSLQDSTADRPEDHADCTGKVRRQDLSGINTIAASIGEEPETIEEVYEPYLIQLGFLHRSPRGRIATEGAFDYFKVTRRYGGVEGQPELF